MKRKVKVCSKCQFQNYSYVSECEGCQNDLTGVRIVEVEADDPISPSVYSSSSTQRDNSNFCMLLAALSWIYLVSGVVSVVYVFFTAVWVENASSYSRESVFSPAGFGIAMGLLLSGIALYGVLNGIARILEK